MRTSTFALLASLAACGLSGPIRTDVKATGYTLAKLPGEWVSQAFDAKVEAVDRLFVSSRSRALIAVGSVCGRYADSSLAALMKERTGPIANLETIDEKPGRVADRESLERTVKGTIDGVPVEARFVVVRKNTCIFDFSLTAARQLAEGDEKTFESFVRGFRYEGP